MLMATKEEYVQAILKLAVEEDHELNESRLRSGLSQHSIDSIDQIYRACCHFHDVIGILGATNSYYFAQEEM